MKRKPVTAAPTVPTSSFVARCAAAGLTIAAISLATAWLVWRTRSDVEVELAVPLVHRDLDEARIRQVCSHCHLFPEPNVLPKAVWNETVWQMFEYSGYGRAVKWPFAAEDLVAWYEARAPQQFDFTVASGATRQTDPAGQVQTGDGQAQSGALDIPATHAAAKAVWSQQPLTALALAMPSVISHLQFADLYGDQRRQVLACDMANSRILVTDAESPAELTVLAQVSHPAHVTVADWDGDGRRDLIVANLGSFLAMDHNLGGVEWLRQREDRTFERIALATGLGRVADVEIADVDDDGDQDLYVAEFGWHSTGRLLWYETRPDANGQPAWQRHEIDGWHGASHLDLVDLDQDGRRELVVLYSQGHEAVRCYQRQPDGTFSVRDLYRAPHPAWGFSGMQVIDLDRDGDADLLLSNGDTFDNSQVKPYHGLQWLENTGGLTFAPHAIGPLLGAYRAEALDADRDGDWDVAACALLPTGQSGLAAGGAIDSLVWFEQVRPGQFVRHVIEQNAGRHLTLTVSPSETGTPPRLFVGHGQLDVSATMTARSAVDVWTLATALPAAKHASDR